jgi:hypothetical protein
MIDPIDPDYCDRPAASRTLESVAFQFGGVTGIVVSDPQAHGTKKVRAPFAVIEELGARLFEETDGAARRAETAVCVKRVQTAPFAARTTDHQRRLWALPDFPAEFSVATLPSQAAGVYDTEL